MAEKSKIQWTDNTWNPAIGCTKVSEECKMCYMMRDFGGRFGKEVNGTVTRTKAGTFNKPLAWKRQGLTAPDGRPLKIFTSSLTDIFHESIDPYRDEIWNIIRQCPEFVFQILTKRPERIKDCLPDDWGLGWDNVWLGTSIGMQKHYVQRLESLAQVDCKVRFLSLEPLLEFVDLIPDDWAMKGWPHAASLSDIVHWIIIGGESGNEKPPYTYRPCERAWVELTIEQCNAYGIPVFVKQMGTHLAKEMGLKDRHGGDWDEWPEELRIRQMPKSYQ